MATRRICDFLDGSAAPYHLTFHAPAFSAQKVAQASHIPGRYMAKTVIVWVDDDLAMAVLPATRALDLEALRIQTGAREVRLALETEFAHAFAECQVGTAPPFGNLFGVHTYVDLKLALQDQIAFNAGTHRDVIRMKFADYDRLVKPRVVPISIQPEAAATQMQCAHEPIEHLGAD